MNLSITSRTLSIAEELLISQWRVKRFLARIGARKLRLKPRDKMVVLTTY